MIPSIGGENFINRGEELSLIENAFAALQDRKLLLRTPIIDFFGVDGIGKTSVLQEVRQRCKQQGLSCIWVNAKQSPVQFWQQWLSQAKPSSITNQLGGAKTDKDLYAQSVDAMKSLLEKEPVVVLLDEVDSDSLEEMSRIEEILHALIDDSKPTNLFVVLASQQQVLFDQYRSVARKLTSHPLKPFDAKASQSYLSDIAAAIDPDIQKEIIAWTHGFPLAIKIMSQIVQEQKLDPRLPEHQKPLISLLIEQVVDQGIFVRVDPNRLKWYKEYISLLSVPRRFNLVILQDITEKFAPDIKLAGKLEYMGLPRQINQGTDVLSWDMRRTGFTIDETVRHLFLRQRAIEQPELFRDIHQFLAELNKQFASEVPGSDRIRYLREYLYHSTFVEDSQTLPMVLDQTLRQIVQESTDAFIQFSEELRQDDELKDALGPHLSIVTDFVNKTFKKGDN
jgi:hypothetical protein